MKKRKLECYDYDTDVDKESPRILCSYTHTYICIGTTTTNRCEEAVITDDKEVSGASSAGSLLSLSHARKSWKWEPYQPLRFRKFKIFCRRGCSLLMYALVSFSFPFLFSFKSRCHNGTCDLLPGS